MKLVFVFVFSMMVVVTVGAQSLHHKDDLSTNAILAITSAFPEVARWPESRPSYSRYWGEGFLTGSLKKHHAIVVSFRDDDLNLHSALVVLASTSEDEHEVDLTQESDFVVVSRSRLWLDLIGKAEGVDATSVFARIENGDIFLDSNDFHGCCQQVNYSHQFKKSGKAFLLIGESNRFVRTDEKVERVIEEPSGCNVNLLKNQKIAWTNIKHRYREKKSNAFKRRPKLTRLDEFLLFEKPRHWSGISSMNLCRSIGK